MKAPTISYEKLFKRTVSLLTQMTQAELMLMFQVAYRIIRNRKKP